jgi:phosphohistidine phosphatase SixA
MRTAAEGLLILGLHPEVVLTSPLVRCAETARILCDTLGGVPIEDDRLRPGMGLAKLAEALAEQPAAAGRALVCGHQPDLSEVTSDLLGGGRIEFRKGAAVVVEVREFRPGGAFLRAAYPPAALRQLGR